MSEHSNPSGPLDQIPPVNAGRALIPRGEQQPLTEAEAIAARVLDKLTESPL